MTPEEKRLTQKAASQALQSNGAPMSGQDAIDSIQYKQLAPTLPTTETESEDDTYAQSRKYINNLLKIQEERLRQQPEQQRKEQAQNFINSIGDAGRALSSLYFTTDYAPVTYDEKSAVSEKSRERAEKAAARRAKELDAYHNYALNLGKLEQNRLTTKRQEESNRIAQRRLDLMEGEYASKQKKRAADIDYREKALDLRQQQLDVDKAYKDGRLSIQQYEAETRRIRANDAKLKTENGISGYSKETIYTYDDMTGKPTKVVVYRTPYGTISADNGEEVNTTNNTNNTTTQGNKGSKTQNAKSQGSLLPKTDNNSTSTKNGSLLPK